MESTGIADRLRDIRARMQAACDRAGRDAASVRLLPVSKTFGPDVIAEAHACGLTVFGESRVQEAMQKMSLCSGELEWHLIGHLQRNKVRDAVQGFSMHHAVDSLRLIDALNAACADAGKTLPVCLEVNVSGERSKFGFAPEAVPEALEHCADCLHLDVVGLMTLPPFDPDAEAARPFFGRLRELRDRWREQTGFPLEELSMGMSHDFESAILEGATWIRVGTALFGGR